MEKPDVRVGIYVGNRVLVPKHLKLLGHSDVATTLGIYSSVLPSMQQDAANRMDDVFEERS